MKSKSSNATTTGMFATREAVCDVVKRRRHSPNWAVLLPLGTGGDVVTVIVRDRRRRCRRRSLDWAAPGTPGIYGDYVAENR